MANEMMVGSQEDGEDCDYVVCIEVSDPLHFPDNLVGKCCKCEKAVQHRPHIPVTPQLICWECALPGMEEARDEGDLKVLVTPKTAQEVIAHIVKKMAN